MFESLRELQWPCSQEGKPSRLVQFTVGGELLVSSIIVKVTGSEIAHLRVGPSFSCISLDGNIFSSFFSQREKDEEFNTSGFIFLKHY